MSSPRAEVTKGTSRASDVQRAEKRRKKKRLPPRELEFIRPPLLAGILLPYDDRLLYCPWRESLARRASEGKAYYPRLRVGLVSDDSRKDQQRQATACIPIC